MKLNKVNAIYFTIAGLLVSIIGQYFIGKVPVLAAVLTTIGVIVAGIGVWGAFYKKSN